MTSNTIDVHPTNAEQLVAWDGDEGAYWAERADHYDRAIAAYEEAFLDAAGIEEADRVLDVGCGAGRTTIDAARRAPLGTALGVDLSARLLDVGRSRARNEAVSNASFLQADAQIHPFEPSGFDVVISRTGAMFFGDRAAAFANLHRALRRGGRLALLTWQPLEGNEWLQQIALALAAGRKPQLPPPGMGPFSLSEPDHVREVLGRAGFADVSLEGHEAPMWFGKDAAEAHAFILGGLGWMLQGLDEQDRMTALDALHATTAAHETGAGVTFRSAAWIITATAE